MAEDPLTPEKTIKESLDSIYKMERIDGVIVIAVMSKVGGYKVHGNILGNLTTRFQIVTEIIRQTAEQMNFTIEDAFTILEGMVKESQIKRPPEPKPGGSLKKSGGSTFTVTKI